MRRQTKFGIAITLITIFLISLFYLSFSYCSAEPYAFKGAKIKYFIDDSEQMYITYEVNGIFGNMMTYTRHIHYASGTWENQTFKERVDDPENFPAVPQGEIGKNEIKLLNLTFNLIMEKKIKINNKTYTALEYVYNKIGFVMDLFIDSQTGIVLNGTRFFHGYLWHISLVDTNIQPKKCMDVYILDAALSTALATITWVIFKNKKQ